MGVAPKVRTALDDDQEQGQRAGSGSDSSGCIPVLRLADIAAPPRTVTVPMAFAPARDGSVTRAQQMQIIYKAEWEAIPIPDRPVNAFRSNDGSCYVIVTIVDPSLAIGD